MTGVTEPCAVACACGWDAGGSLRVTTDDFFGRLHVTEDAGPDDARECPECGEWLTPETVVARTVDACPACGSPVAVALGVLGRRVHLRCRDCGIDYSRLEATR